MVQRLDGRLQVRVAGHQDHGDVEIVLPHGAQELKPVQARHQDVTQDRVELRRHQVIQGLAAVDGGHDVVARILEGLCPELQESDVVVDEKNAAFGLLRGHGSSTLEV